ERVYVVHVTGTLDRHFGLPPGHVAQLGCLIDDVIGRQIHETRNAQIHERPQPGHRSADAGAGETVLRDRHAPDPPFVEARHELAAAVHGDVLAHHDDSLVAFQLFYLSLQYLIQEGHLHHRVLPRLVDRQGHMRVILTLPKLRLAADREWDCCTCSRTRRTPVGTDSLPQTESLAPPPPPRSTRSRRARSR